MKVMRLEDSPPLFGSEPLLVEDTVPQPLPGPGELLIRVSAVGITPTELLWYPTTHTKSGDVRRRAIPGHEFCGIVMAAGPQAEGFHIGQSIFGMNDWFADGALAEYCITQPSSIAASPAFLSPTEAASVPISALTAWQGLFDRARLQPGETVLVHGGAGAVGLFAVQLACSNGAHVIATASQSNLAFAKELGAKHALDYRATRFEEAIQPVDVVFDTVGGETLQRSWNILKPGGRLVTIAADSEGTSDERTKQSFFIVEPNQKQLIKIADLLQTGRLRTFVDAVLPLSHASDAFTGKVDHRRGHGKLVVSVHPPL